MWSGRVTDVSELSSGTPNGAEAEAEALTEAPKDQDGDEALEEVAIVDGGLCRGFAAVLGVAIVGGKKKKKKSCDAE